MDNSFWDFTSFFRSVASYGWWRVLLELVLIGVVVTWLIRFLRGTRGARMLQGMAFFMIGLFLVVQLVADKLDLERIAYLYQRLLVIAAFGMVIIFQPELRRALMHLGETRLFRSFSNQINAEIDEIIQATTFLSKRKIGAIVAIERDISLATLAESGTHVNANLSAPLLETIFWPNSPLHDLGVIVSQGRISYAGVQFPMAEPGDLEQELGARHRAALGLSQDCDAVVVVVSEETGNVSVAERGKLIRQLTPDGLRGLLLSLLTQKTESSQSSDDSSSDSVA
ncbi:MAG: TIGR00159 family protein [Phycisphaerales bacterium]|nr:TIGR00159 family protein [Phycisphaerales bacterium]